MTPSARMSRSSVRARRCPRTSISLLTFSTSARGRPSMTRYPCARSGDLIRDLIRDLALSVLPRKAIEQSRRSITTAKTAYGLCHVCRIGSSAVGKALGRTTRNPPVARLSFDSLWSERWGGKENAQCVAQIGVFSLAETDQRRIVHDIVASTNSSLTLVPAPRHGDPASMAASSHRSTCPVIFTFLCSGFISPCDSNTSC